MDDEELGKMVREMLIFVLEDRLKAIKEEIAKGLSRISKTGPTMDGDKKFLQDARLCLNIEDNIEHIQKFGMPYEKCVELAKEQYALTAEYFPNGIPEEWL